MERRVTVPVSGRIYDVIIGENLHYGEILKKVHKCCKVLIVSDDTVNDLYGQKCISMLNECGFEASLFSFLHGEQSKTLQTAGDILTECARLELTRTDLLVALGGGVVGDITGFVASIYLRGLDYVQMPTTFLAAVDSSVGGKTAVDLPVGKNLVGAFHQPIVVICDILTFQTLPDSVLADGTAEAIKYGVIKDADLFEHYEYRERNYIEEVYRCVSIKAEIVSRDEFDMGERKLLNFGHTPGHAIEVLSGYQISHGYAVAIGMRIMTEYMEKNHRIEKGSTERLINTLKRNSLPYQCDYIAEQLAEVALMDKKRAGESISLVVPNRFGEAIIEQASIYELTEIFRDAIE